MNKDRLVAFSDGFFAVIITIMVLELKAPHGTDWSALRPVLPTFLCYVLSFIYLAIYWNNHHHMLQIAERVNGAILWANLHLLFWLSLVPFATAWVGENEFASVPVMAYGINLLLSGSAYYILSRTLIRRHGQDSLLAEAMGTDAKGIASLVLYSVAVLAGGWQPLISCAIYVLVAVMWLIPDRRVERLVEAER